MVPIHKLWGRLGNQLFIFASHYASTRASNKHFFVQDELFFKEYENEIRQLFSGGITPNSVDRVAIHRRLGDYQGNTFYVDLGHHSHENLDDNYYMRAMAQFPEGTQFTVFSDDIETAKKEPMFQGEQFEFSEGRDEVEDLNYMACHKSHIIANSSFSWWGAYLGKWEGQKVIAPAKWFANEEDNKFIGVPKIWQRL